MDFGLDEVQLELRDLAAEILGVPLPEAVGGSGYGVMEMCVRLQEIVATAGLGMPRVPR